MTQTANETPIGVHLTGSDVDLGSGPAAGGTRAVYRTVYLMAADPSQGILPASDKRIIAFIQALDDDIVIGGNQSDVANSSGTTVPQSNGSPWPVLDAGAVYAYAATYSGGSSIYSRVSVTAFYRV